jgi:non-heme chloroperoxidase
VKGGVEVSFLDEHTSEQIVRANASGRPPVVFIHGLWLLASSWDRWGVIFDEAAYAPVLAAADEAEVLVWEMHSSVEDQEPAA